MDTWKPMNTAPKDGYPILISLERYEYPVIGYYSEFDEDFVTEDMYSEDDIPVERKLGKMNGWMPLPKCKNKA